MTPTEFDFTVQMPGDARLVGAIRQLTAHAAAYAHLSAEAGEGLAAQVERAAEAAVSAARPPHATIEFRFSASAEALLVTFTCQLADAPAATTAAANGVTVEWSRAGDRHVCRIRQPLPGA